MFGGNIWGAIAPASEALLDKERAPPPKPTPLEFPCYVPPRSDDPLDSHHLESLCKDLASVRRPWDVKDSQLAQFNIQLEQDVSLADMVPDERFKSRPLLYDSDLTSMLKELDVENEDAYREVIRLPPLPGRQKPRLAYSRAFFTSLEDMCRYWDDSKDDYYEVEVDGQEGSNTEFSPTPSTTKETEKRNAEKKETKALSGETKQTTEGTNSDGEQAEHNTSLNADRVEIPHRSKTKQVYRGLRIGSGQQMSPGTRVAAVRNLLKMAIHKFNCRDHDFHPREKFRIRNINLPSTFLHFCVAKMPAESRLARARFVEGPLMGVHSRMEVRFRPRDGSNDSPNDFVGEKYDLFREVSGLLMLAKQRAREGQTPSKEPHQDHWWALRHRWGGGPTRWGQLACEVFEDDDPSWSPEERQLQLDKRTQEEEERKRTDVLATATDLNNLKPEDLLSLETSSGNVRPKKKKKGDDDSKDKAEYKDGRRLMFTAPIRRKWYQEWTKVRPNSSTWDEKLIYRRIGVPDPEQGWDDVYMLSAANHHVCLVKLSVHENYLQWLETGNTKHQALKSGRQDHVLYMTRSRWFNLLDVDQRKELLTGIWCVLSWLNRDEVPKVELEKMENLKQEQEQQESDNGGDHPMET
ncbi:uncharacterized protein PV06_02690 [Exophiala oligosperma]|uniref:Uncharacterized protein n=1 Tax=Exophiala oligosperma TaxID=215243 RepID=A0A0D2EGM1_9EURO|nr:uncharacterized protein PV06_02690 [Exophiala oligosperma]KIW47084.1 hypothetical protein PV06_02690 [Exophiala oligosperma]